jgi:hypothetical protein
MTCVVPSGRIGFDLHCLAAQVHVRLEVLEYRGLFQDRETLVLHHRIRRDVE